MTEEGHAKDLDKKVWIEEHDSLQSELLRLKEDLIKERVAEVPKEKRPEERTVEPEEEEAKPRSPAPPVHPAKDLEPSAGGAVSTPLPVRQGPAPTQAAQLETQKPPPPTTSEPLPGEPAQRMPPVKLPTSPDLMDKIANVLQLENKLKRRKYELEKASAELERNKMEVVSAHPYHPSPKASEYQWPIEKRPLAEAPTPTTAPSPRSNPLIPRTAEPVKSPASVPVKEGPPSAPSPSSQPTQPVPRTVAPVNAPMTVPAKETPPSALSPSSQPTQPVPRTVEPVNAPEIIPAKETPPPAPYPDPQPIQSIPKAAGPAKPPLTVPARETEPSAPSPAPSPAQRPATSALRTFEPAKPPVSTPMMGVPTSRPMIVRKVVKAKKQDAPPKVQTTIGAGFDQKGTGPAKGPAPPTQRPTGVAKGPDAVRPVEPPDPIPSARKGETENMQQGRPLVIQKKKDPEAQKKA